MDDQDETTLPAELSPELNGHEVAINQAPHVEALTQFTQAVVNSIQLNRGQVNAIQLEVGRVTVGIIVDTLIEHLAQTGLLDETAYQIRLRDKMLGAIQQSSPIIRPS